MRKYIFLATALLISFQGINAQTKLLDSLIAKLNVHRDDDTTKVQLLNSVSANAWGFDPQITKRYAEKALALSEKLKYAHGIAESYAGISRYYWTQTEYDKSVDFALIALKHFELCKDLKGISGCYSIMGTSYSQGNNFDKAIYYHTLALELNTKINNKSGIGRNLNNLGYTFELQQNFQKALQYYKRGLDIRLEIGNKNDIALSFANVGSIYYYLKNYPLSLQYLFKALPMAQAVNSKNYIALIYQNIGEVYYKTKKYKEGDFYLQNALQIANEIGDKKRRECVYEALKNLEESRNNYKAAFHYLELLQSVRDTLYTQDRSAQLAKMETLYETNKKEQTIKLLQQNHQIQTIWKNALIGGLVLVALVSVIIYRLQKSRTRKTKELLGVQQSLNEKLTEIDKIKSHFFANISHEFRTPLTLLLAPLEEKLSCQTLTQTEKESFVLMKRNANRLLDLVNQLLDLSKLEAGKMKLNIKSNNLNEFVTILLTSFDSLADYKKINFLKKINLKSHYYQYDADVIEKILTNLLSNAFKFTPAHGTVTASINSELISIESQEKNFIKINVTDTGKGIPKCEQTEIFSRFYQAANTSEDGQLGSGLGLSLVKELAKLHGGSIKLFSEENHGTSINIEIPLAEEREIAAPLEINMAAKNSVTIVNENLPQNIESPEQEEVHEDLILVVEDNEDLRNFITTLLQKDFRVITATNGKEGMKQAIEHIPCLIVSDLMMPGWDGMMLTDKIKNDERTSHIPIVILTAKNEMESRLEGFKVGADDYLTKPFSTEELRVRITNLIEQRKLLAAKFREKIVVLPTTSQEVSMDEKFLQRLKAVIETNMNNFSFSVEQMAECISMSRTQLLRKVKALTGLSPNEFIKDMRLRKAVELIKSNSDTISQIGYKVGFNDQSYFTKCFKKHYGVSPTEYYVKIKSI